MTETRLWRVHFVVATENGKKVKLTRRAILVEASNDDEAERLARPEATKFCFGPRVLAVDWKMTATVELPLDISALRQTL